MGKHKKSIIEESEKSDELVKQKNLAVDNIKRIHKTISEGTISLESVQLQCRLDILTQFINKAMDVQMEIDAIRYDPEDRSALEELCITAKADLLALIQGSKKADTSNSNPHNHPSKSKLPTMKLPKFSGNYADFKNFIGLFENLVDNDPTLCNIEKFNHLISCLSDEALGTIKSYQISDENYPKALASLKSIYDNKCLMFFNTIAKLFALPQSHKPSASNIRTLVDAVSAIYDSLLSVGNNKDISNAILIHLAMSKVDSITRSKWEEQLDYNTLPSWSDCQAMLNKRFQHLTIEESSSQKQVDTSQKCKGQNNKSANNKQSSLSVTRETNHKNGLNDNCLYCQSKEHALFSCPSFTSISLSQRSDFVKNSSLCYNCLRKGHSVSRCRSSKCRICKRPHNTLHKFSSNHNPSTSTVPETIQPSTSAAINHASNAEEHVILATAVVKVRNIAGDYILARALLDSGSQVNCITEQLANTLSLKRKSKSVPIVGIGNANQIIRHCVEASVQSCINDFTFDGEYLVMKAISTDHPDRNLPVDQWEFPKNVKLADPCFHKPQRVDMLIGAEIFFDLLCVGQCKISPNLPTLQKTLFGWIISGKYAVSRQPNSSCLLLAAPEESFDLHSFVKQFWECEELPKNTQIKMIKEHEECENKFIQSVKQLPSGRLKVSLPFKAEPSLLGASFETAKRRFLTLEKILQRNPEMHKMYMEFMTEYLELGHMSPIHNSTIPNPHYYIPHQCVMRLSSTTTKLRVVFDASSKTSSQVSLNDILMVGPTIQPDLYAIILRFRLHKFAITADITKTYRQFEIDEADRKFQLILWRKNPSDPIKTLQLNTVTYGTSSAPFLAIRCLKYLSDTHTISHPIGSSVIATNFYVDDLLAGAETLTELNTIRCQVTEILQSAGINLSKWSSNHSSYENDRAERTLKVNDVDCTTALGIKWNPRDDHLYFKFESDFDQLPATKRNILSISSRLFDPLGLVSPFVIQSKMILQELWLNKLHWDESIPQRLEMSWNQVKDDLKLLSSVSVPRFVHIHTQARIEIHGFADASSRAYGCCLYVRSCLDDTIFVNLLTAKSRVAPLKTRSLPRLELSAAFLLAKLWQTISPLLNFDISRLVFWTDSEITLHWLKSHPSTLKTFVANRVAEIQEISEHVEWMHVPSKLNPADLVSRGCRVNDLKESIWFQGPQFLCQEPSQWPKNKKFELSEEQLNVETRPCKVLLTTMEEPPDLLYELILNTSSYPKLLRIFAYILRVLRVRKPKGSKTIDFPPTATELRLAFFKIIQVIQAHTLSEEIECLNKSKSLPTRYQKLCPFMHTFEDNHLKFSLIRVGGRLLNAPLPYDAKFPLLLPQGHFVEIYIRYLHFKNLHAGAKVLIGLLRQEIWTINAREQCSKIVRRCVHCYKYKPILLNQIMGNLPTERVTSCRPFFTSGVDFCGPVNVTLKIRGRPPVKCYIAVFVCFASKAIHLETVSDLTSDSFILCLKRFTSRRGVPKKLFCDNATNFVGAQRRLDDLRKAFESQKNQLESYAASEGMEFAFIPPRAPHFGGLWEAGVKSAKTLLVKAIGKMLPTPEELQTILAEIESILNSRPIAPYSNDPNDGEVLTPNHLLHGETKRSLPPEFAPTVVESKIPLLKRWQQLSTVKTAFWQAWSRDYLHTLQQRNKWCKDQPNLDIGKLVLIHEDNLRPQHWLMGRVINVVRGGDNKVRVADIKTATGVCRRPITKLSILPID